MKKNQKGFSEAIGQMGDSIKSALSVAGRKLSRIMKGSTKSRAGGRMSASRPLDEANTPIRSSAASNLHTVPTRPEQHKSRSFKVPFNLSNKKRFTAVLSGVVAAIMIPVFVTSAGGAGFYTSTNGSVNYAVPDHVDTLQANTGATAVTAYTTARVVTTPTAVQAADPTNDEGSSEVSEVTDDSAASTSAETADTSSAEGGDSEATESVEPEEEKIVTLQPGDTSDAVIALQQRLMELHYMENDEPTNYYGPQTQQAVGYFQRKNGLDVDGCAGPLTQELLFSNDAKVYTVSEGASGADVWGIQERLEELGYPIAVTGYYGTSTTAAVQYFQRMSGITDDGTVGMDTKDLLFSDQAERAIPPEPDPEPQTESGGDGSSSGDGESSGGGSSSGGGESSGGGGGSSNGGSSGGGESSGGSSSDDDDEDSSSSGGGGGGNAPSANSGSVEAFINAACAQEGKPYVLGGKGPNTFDCSGLVYYALNASGYSIGYMTSGGWASSGYPSISWDNLQRGDVLCFSGHVGVYLGGGMMCDASSSNGQIMIRGMGNWARNNFICGKRPL